MALHSVNLTWLRSFETAARVLNFTQAARELGLTPAAVSLHIKSLEGTLGYQLFRRNARHLSLTALGAAYYDSVSDALADIDRATHRLFAPKDRAVLTVRVPVSTAALWLGPRLAEFSALHPDVHVRLVSTIWETEGADDNIDVDIRYGLGQWLGVEVEKISNENMVLIRKPDVVEHTKTNGAAQFIHVLGNEDMWEGYRSSHPEFTAAADPIMTVDTTAVAMSLVASGLGYAAVQTRFARRAIDDGMGIEIVGAPMAIPQCHYLVQGISKRPAAHMFSDWLRAVFADDAG